MKKIEFLLKISMVIVLLQGLMYCPIDWGQIDQDIQQETVDAYLESVLNAMANQKVFYNFTEMFKSNACRVFNKHFEKLFFLDFKLFTKAPLSIEILGKKLRRNGSGAIALAHIATLAQDTPQCWNKQIKKIENIIKSTEKGKLLKFKEMFRKSQKPHISQLAAKQDLLKEAKFLYEVFLDSAARAYVFMEDMYIKNKKLEKWWHIKTKLTRTPPDFYILAVLESIRKFMPHEFKNIRENFLTNFRLHLEKSKLKATQKEIDDIVDNIEKKSTPSFLKKYINWYYVAGFVAVAGVSYWIYQNQDELQKNVIDRLFGKTEEAPTPDENLNEPSPDNQKQVPGEGEQKQIENKGLTGEKLATKELDVEPQAKVEAPKVEGTPNIENQKAETPKELEPKKETETKLEEQKNIETQKQESDITKEALGTEPQQKQQTEPTTQKDPELKKEEGETKSQESDLEKENLEPQKQEILPQPNKSDESKDIESDESGENNESLSEENKSGENVINIGEQKEGELSSNAKAMEDKQKDQEPQKIEEQKPEPKLENEPIKSGEDIKAGEQQEGESSSDAKAMEDKQKGELQQESNIKKEELETEPQKSDLEKEKGSETKSEEQKNIEDQKKPDIEQEKQDVTKEKLETESQKQEKTGTEGQTPKQEESTREILITPAIKTVYAEENAIENIQKDMAQTALDKGNILHNISSGSQQLKITEIMNPTTKIMEEKITTIYNQQNKVEYVIVEEFNKNTGISEGITRYEVKPEFRVSEEEVE